MNGPLYMTGDPSAGKIVFGGTPGVANGLTFYDTSDENVNFRKYRMFTDGSGLNLKEERGGTASLSNISFAFQNTADNGSPQFVFTEDGGMTVNMQNHLNTGIQINTASGQAGNVFQITNLGNQILSWMSASGGIGASGTLEVDGASTFNTTSTFNSDAVFGSTSINTVTINGVIKSGLTPSANNNYDLGTTGLKWNNVYASNYYIGAQQSQRLCGSQADVGTFQLVAIGDCNAGGADIAEHYGVTDSSIEAGDVIKIADPQNNKPYIQKTDKAYDGAIGVVSTAPYDEFGKIYSTSTERSVPVALAGRVPVKVSNENGAIAVGDYLTSASLPGYAMKMTGPGITVGRALSSFDGASATSTVEVFTGTGYYNGDGFSSYQGSQNLTVSTDPSNIGPILAQNGFDMASSTIINVASISGAKWSIDANGNFTTSGEIVKKIETSAGEKDAYPVYNLDPTIMLTGSGQISNGEARIIFDPALSGVMDPSESIKVSVTMTSEGAQGIFVAEKSIGDILVREINAGHGGASFDYIIIAKRKMGLASAGGAATSTPSVVIPAEAGIQSLPVSATSTPPSLTPANDIATSTPTNPIAPAPPTLPPPLQGGGEEGVAIDNQNITPTSTISTATTTPEMIISTAETATSTEQLVVSS
ncbi:MAG: hypothetical protein V1661_01445, partial [bacterium]